MQQGDTVHLNPDRIAGVTAAWAVEFGYRDLIVQSMPTGRNAKNAVVKVKGADATARGLKIPPADLVSGPYPTNGTPTVQPFTVPDFLDPGTVVRWKQKPKPTDADLWVVTGASANGHRLFPLGGSDRYYRSIPAARLTVVPLAELTKAGA